MKPRRWIGAAGRGRGPNARKHVLAATPPKGSTAGSLERMRAAVVVAAVGLGVALLPPAAMSYERPAATQRVDLTLSGDHPERGYAQTSSLSNDGRVIAFDSDANDIVTPDTNLLSDVFVRDIRTGRTIAASRSPFGGTAIGPPSLAGVPGGFWLSSTSLSVDPQISGNGRYVAFTSAAVNLVGGDTNLAYDVFVFDRQRGSVRRVSVNSDEQQATPPPAGTGSYYPSISRDGRFVTFSSDATNLVKNDTNAASDVFLRDLRKGTTVRVSVDGRGDQQEGQFCLDGLPSSISADGRIVAFSSCAGDLVPDDTNMISDVFVYTRKTRKVERVSVPTNGAQAISEPDITDEGSTLAPFAGSGLRSISATGRYVVFGSTTINLVPSDTNGGPFRGHGEDVFVHDRKTGRTERVSVDFDGREVNQEDIGPIYSFIWAPAISVDGRYVTFVCGCGSKPPSAYPQAGHEDAVVVADRVTGSVTRVPWPTLRSKHFGDKRSTELIFPDLSKGARYVSTAAFISRQFPTIDAGIFRIDRGTPLGAAVTRTQGSGGRGGAVHDGVLIVGDERGDSLPTGADDGLDILEATMAWRPEHSDLYIKLDLTRLAPPLLSARVGKPGVLYVAGFSATGVRYEVRVSAVPIATFELFRCTDECRSVSPLRGGYGTRGENVVVSVPMELLGTDGPAPLHDIRLATGVGLLHTGLVRVFDEVAP